MLWTIVCVVVVYSTHAFTSSLHAQDPATGKPATVQPQSGMSSPLFGPIGAVNPGNSPSSRKTMPESARPVTLPKGTKMVREGRYAITDAKPMASAAQLLSQKLAVPISYEDGAWLDNGTFEFDLPATTVGLLAAAPESVIQSVIARYNGSGHQGEFKLVRFGDDEFIIVAASLIDKNGTKSPQVLPMDTRITFPASRRTLFDAISLICEKAGLYNNVSWSGYMGNTFTETGADNETARTVLARVVGRRPVPFPFGKLGWIVNISRAGGAQLDLYEIRYEVAGPDGVIRLEGAVWYPESFNK